MASWIGSWTRKILGDPAIGAGNDVPFDNNQAERDLRMMKTKQKISGCFRNLTYARAFANLRPISSRAKKHSINVLEIIKTPLSDPLRAQEILLGN